MSDGKQAMTEESLKLLLEETGARVMSRAGRNEHYGAPREFSYEVKAIFDNGLGLHILARQFNYHEAWETGGRINEIVDVSLLRQGQYCEMPKGQAFFQGRDCEAEVDLETLRDIIACTRQLNPKLFTLQGLTGDL